MKKIETIKRMPTEYEKNEYKKHKQKDIEIIGSVCLVIMVIAVSLLIIG